MNVTTKSETWKLLLRKHLTIIALSLAFRINE